jgi:2-amino-4-hydroxy-6-hydroxymethyldihydropteridine diphosphokinase
LNGLKRNKEKNQSSVEVFLLLGSNIQPKENILLAIKKLREKMRIASISSVWETKANKNDDPNFLNCIVRAITCLSIDELKKNIIRPIEDNLLRVRTENKNASRTIDIDIILYDNLEIDATLWKQVYIAVPLAQLIPNYLNKRTNKKLFDVAEKMKKDNFILQRNDVKEIECSSFTLHSN